MDERRATVEDVGGAAEPATVDSLLTALGARVPQARERSEAARSLALAVAVGSGMDADSQATVATAAALHELGKLYLDPELLPYPPLDATAAQRRGYELHFEHGRGLAEGAGLPNRVYSAILHSRERWDGEGPQGLSGTEIPLGARVVAVAREYAGAPTLGAVPGGDPRAVAATHLSSLAGSILDPELVGRAVEAIDPGRAG